MAGIESSTHRLTFVSGAYDVVYLAWPDMRAFRRFAIEPEEWHAFEPEQFRVSGDPMLPPSPYAVMDFRRFMSRVPEALVAEVARFPEDHWALLSWLARAGVIGDDLLRSNPCLALMLAKAPSFGTRSRRAIPIWAVRPYCPQRELLGKLGFPSTEPMRRLVHKVVFSAMSIPRLRAARDAIRSAPALVAELSHIRRINANALAAIGGGGVQVTPRLLTRLSDPANDDPTATLGSAIADTVRGWRLLHPRRPLPLFDGIACIRRLHEQIVEELSLHKGRGTLPFPAPPVEGTETIVPLRTAIDLVVEGRDQHNCVASYERLARRGDVALYRVTAPERATLSLVCDRGRWKVSELKGPCNRRVSPKTREAVRKWLASETDKSRRPPRPDAPPE